MATPAGQGYRSPLNLGLEQLPKTVDPTLFQEFIPIYNAIHTLNAYLDNIRLSLEGGDPEKKPSEEMRFVRGFWLEAATDIAQGKVITVQGGKAVLGCGKRVKGFSGTTSVTVGDDTVTRPVKISGQVIDCFLTGLAMTDALAGEKVRMGIGPAIIEVSGFKAGDEVWSQPPGGSFAGDFLAESFEGAIRIGRCVIDNFIMLVPDYLNI